MNNKEEIIARETLASDVTGNLGSVALQSAADRDLHGWRSPRRVRLHLLPPTSVLCPNRHSD